MTTTPMSSQDRRQQRTDRQLTMAAAAYRHALANGKPPLTTIATATEVPEGTIKAIIRRARLAGLPLTPTGDETASYDYQLPLLRPQKNETPEQQERRFWAYVVKGTPDECWPWLGTINEYGYGSFYIKKRAVGAHRVAFTFANGRPPGPGLLVRHTCNNRPCCNPNHLREGTHQDNGADLRLKNGRHRCPACGEWCSNGYARPSNAL